jgi:hypothetical protein
MFGIFWYWLSQSRPHWSHPGQSFADLTKEEGGGGYTNLSEKNQENSKVNFLAREYKSTS